MGDWEYSMPLNALPLLGFRQTHVIGLIAGGDGAIRTAVEGAEDDSEQGWKDLENLHVSTLDTVVGIAASGTTPYVVVLSKHVNLKESLLQLSVATQEVL